MKIEREKELVSLVYLDVADPLISLVCNSTFKEDLLSLTIAARLYCLG